VSVVLTRNKASSRGSEDDDLLLRDWGCLYEAMKDGKLAENRNICIIVPTTKNRNVTNATDSFRPGFDGRNNIVVVAAQQYSTKCGRGECLLTTVEPRRSRQNVVMLCGSSLKFSSQL
jgi:hypothetical protein